MKAVKTSQALFLDERKDDLLVKSVRNIHGAGVSSPSEVNAADVLKYDTFIISETALNALQQRLKGSK